MFNNDILIGLYLITFVVVFINGMNLIKDNGGTVDKLATLASIFVGTFILCLGEYGVYLIITSLMKLM